MTSKKYFQDQMTQLEAAFSSAYSKEQLSRCYDGAKGYEPQHIKRAVDNLIVSAYRLPIIAQVIQEIRSQWEHDWDLDKESDKQVAKDMLNSKRLKMDSPHIQDAMKLVRQTLFGKFDRDTFYKGILAMETKHPGHGWKENAETFKHKTIDHPGRAPFTPHKSRVRKIIDGLKRKSTTDDLDVPL